MEDLAVTKSSVAISSAHRDDDSCDDEYDYMIMVVMIMMMVKFTWLTQALNVVNACPICKQDIPTWPMKS